MIESKHFFVILAPNPTPAPTPKPTPAPSKKKKKKIDGKWFTHEKLLIM